MVAFLSVLFVVAALAALSWLRTWRAVRLLRDRTVTELNQLMSKLRVRHLIISHLVDSLPSDFHWDVDRQQLAAARGRAEQSLGRIDPGSPQQSDVCTFCGREKLLLALIEELTQRIEADDAVGRIHSVAGCLQGLEKAQGEITDSVSTYNTAAIAYSTYLESSRIARIFSAGEFTLCDLDTHGSGISRTEYVES